MSVTTHDIAVGIAALIAFPLAVNLPAALATDGSPDQPRLERGQNDQVQPVRTTTHLPR